MKEKGWEMETGEKIRVGRRDKKGRRKGMEGEIQDRDVGERVWEEGDGGENQRGRRDKRGKKEGDGRKNSGEGGGREDVTVEEGDGRIRVGRRDKKGGKREMKGEIQDREVGERMLEERKRGKNQGMEEG